VEAAIEAGADAVGLIFAPSPRQVALADARAIVAAAPAFVSVLGVFVNPDAALVAAVRELGCVPQFSGDETPAFCAEVAGMRYVKALHLEAGTTYSGADVAALAARFPDADAMFDTRAHGKYGGTGTRFSWPLVEPIARRRRVIVSGGLDPENVADCVRTVRPFAVDVRSGVETDGRKDREKMRAFVRAVRETDAET
jgi:phosphoribosylanthranilate isomerase